MRSRTLVALFAATAILVPPSGVSAASATDEACAITVCVEAVAAAEWDCSIDVEFALGAVECDGTVSASAAGRSLLLVSPGSVDWSGQTGCELEGSSCGIFHTNGSCAWGPVGGGCDGNVPTMVFQVRFNILVGTCISDHVEAGGEDWGVTSLISATVHDPEGLGSAQVAVSASERLSDLPDVPGETCA